ncbi:MAG: hypothetical protein QF466_06900 [Desulfobacterales bacterium]|jgi:type II pantothenate kinase|nr:hypothetical protein [Desulfobacter sp.]MDP6395160.1 hypothetical protein [Desulfobacterales bacterium]MDP6683213.1 hypothetical protein [Desulfobacterales bacterium]MDP6806366.1 hypothetical protein [Desulfobacterales bacterium]|tara:strand:- start:32311 stop:33150 length:840 start_codon:yes stop_codon:yes gene_type:complete
MNNLKNMPIIGIDRGASFTDFGVVVSNQLIDAVSVNKRDWDSIFPIYERLIGKYQTDLLVFTGSVSDMPADLEKRIQVIPEIDSVGFGGSTLADCNECIVVSFGTGSAIVHFADNHSKHVGGTGIGGGTIQGLSSLMCGIENPEVVETQALKGNASHLNLTISDLGYERISFLGSDVTAGNFASVQSKQIEDLAAAILTLVAETVGIISSICAREAGCVDKIVVVGKVAQNQFIRHILNLVGKLYQTTFIFPDKPGFATVYGAAMKYKYDLLNPDKKNV